MTKHKGSSGRRFETTRLFSLQLADHDTVFAPRQRGPRNFRWVTLLFYYLPAFVAFAMPSFQLGIAEFRDPGVKIPDRLSRGEVFTLPADNDELVPRIAGQDLLFIDAKSPLYLGAAVKSSDFEVTYDFVDHDQKRRIKGIIPRPKHPRYAYFVKRVHVSDRAPASEVLPEAQPVEVESRPAPPLSDAEIKALTIDKGTPRLRCWKEPKLDQLAVDILNPRRHTRFAALTISGQGEVVSIRPIPNELGGNDHAVIVHHGGGLFSRYWGIRELRTRLGAKVNAGQTVGNVSLSLKKGVATPATWEPMIGGDNKPAALSARSLLEVSSQLCGSK